MKTKLCTLILAFVASVGSIYAAYTNRVIVGDLKYLLDEDTKTAKVTYRYMSVDIGIPRYNQISDNEYWDIENANIPATIVYNEETYDVIGIGEYAFQHCDSLRSITIPSSITAIEHDAFRYCQNLSEIHISDIAAWCTNDYKDNNPLSLAHNLYLNDELITNLVIPEGVTSISEKAFYDCDNITSVIIPGSVTNIGKDAFRYCGNLKSATIGYCDIETSETPMNYMSIEEFAFYSSSLDTVIIGKNVANIEYSSFARIGSGLKSVTLYSDTLVSRAYRSNYTLGAFFGEYVEDYIIGEGVKSIGKYAFLLSSMKSITLPKSLTHIDTKAISSGRLEAIHISDLASWCAVTFASTDIETSNPLLEAHNLYLNDSLITDLVLPDNISSIGEWTFCGGSFNTITIPSNISNIGKKAFYACDSLTSVTFIDPHLNIGKEAFSKCANLKTVHTTDLSLWYHMNFATLTSNPLFYAHNLYCNGALVTDLIIPSSITSINNYVFCGGSNINSINIPSSVEYIGDGAFYRCTNLSSIEIPNSVKFIGKEAFMLCENLISVEMPDSLTSINDECFYYCGNLKAITLPNGITSIGVHAFGYCKSITEVTIPSGVTNIGTCAFTRCDSLASVSIPEGVSSIGQSAFCGTNLSSVILPNSLVEVKEYVFHECNNLEYIILLAETPPSVTHFDFFVSRSTPIYVPCGTLEAYMTTKWSSYNIQYQPNFYALNISSLDTLKGQVDSEGNICVTTLSAIPKEGNYFVQWSDGNTENPRTITLTQDTTITAIFATQTFTITFVDDNDTILSSQEYEYGSTIVPPTDPIKTNDAQYTYTFAGWSPQFVAVTSDATYKATYTSTLNEYTITFMNEDSILSADMWEYGSTPVYRGSTPTKAEDERYTYTFDAWTPEIVSVVADATYTATFTATEKTEAIENIMDNSSMPTKYIDNNNIYILMPNGKKYSIIGEIVK